MAKMSAGKMAKMLRRAQEAQEKVQAEIAAMEVEGSAGGGAVTARVDGNRTLLSLEIAPEVLEDGDAGMLADLVLAAVNQAQRKAEEEAAKKMEALTRMLGLPPGLGF